MNTLPPADPAQPASAAAPRYRGAAGPGPAEVPASPRRRRALTVGAAAAAAVLVQLVATGALGIDLVAATGEDVTRTVGAGDVLVAALVAGAGGWAVLALVERVTPHARAVWASVAVVVLAISLVGPLTMASGAAAAALVALHLVVGAVLIPGLSGPTRR